MDMDFSEEKAEAGRKAVLSLVRHILARQWLLHPCESVSIHG
jgi:hypothetical protein